MLNKIFHIYSDGQCIHANLNEDSFNGLWEYYHMEGVKCDYEVCDVPRQLEEASY
jgi:hypothetical protein